MNNNIDKTIVYLLDLDGIRYVIDESIGLWVKFEVRKVSRQSRNHGIRYSLTLHDKTNQRIMGFDNAHTVEYGAKNNVAPKRTYDHWHHDADDKGKPYQYETAAKLLEDFWVEVEKKLKKYED